jgi:hypothetical protein
MKTLRPGPRPFVAFAIVCGPLFLLPLYIGVAQGKWSAAEQLFFLFLMLPVLFFGPMVFLRIEVDEEEIRLRNFGVVRKRARFEEIGHSRFFALAEKDWPISLTVFGKAGNSELMTIRLKIFRKEDVAWLVALPQLRAKK